MNRADTELFETLERDWVHFVSKFEASSEIPWQAEGLMAKMQIYLGDLPRSGAYKPDMMPSTIDKYRKIYTTDSERFAMRMIFRVPKNLQKFVMIEPLIRRKEKVTQDVIANVCGCTLDQYKKGRAKAKLFWVYEARKAQLKNGLIAVA